MNHCSYEDLIDPSKILDVYHDVKVHTRCKNKLLKYDMFLSSNISNICESLKNKSYSHKRYNIFLVNVPKPRIIMSERLYDKIINHLFSKYVFLPLINPKLINTNVATRKNKGTNAGIYYMKKYLNLMKNKYSKFYVLKCDIEKYFYSIDHEILLKKFMKLTCDSNILNVFISIIDSTNSSYLNKSIDKVKNKRISDIRCLKIRKKEKEELVKQIENLPHYKLNKGLPIGNVSSQIFAIFYLNDLDHYIKEKLHIRYYIRYMDDFLLFHQDKKYLQECLVKINDFAGKEKLKINKKTQIISSKSGINFLGYRFIVKNNKVHVLMNSKHKRVVLHSKNKINYKGYTSYLTFKIREN